MDARHSLTRRQLMQGASVVGLGLLAGCGRLPGQAQAPAWRIGYLHQSFDGPQTDGLRQGLRDLGYVEGQNLVVEYRFAEGRLERLPALAAELVGFQPVLIAANGSIAPRVVSDAAPSMPIVISGGGGAPVELGLVAGFARPGGNITGVITASVDIAAKWLEMLREALPGLSRVALLSDPTADISVVHVREIERAAVILGVQVQSLSLGDPAELPALFATIQQAPADGLILLPGGRAGAQRSRIAELALAHHLPAVSEWREFAEAGGLMAYGADAVNLSYRAATFVDKILKGAKPADLPVERPMHFEFVINLKSAQTLGLALPQRVLLQATEIIQ